MAPRVSQRGVSLKSAVKVTAVAAVVVDVDVVVVVVDVVVVVVFELQWVKPFVVDHLSNSVSGYSAALTATKPWSNIAIGGCKQITD